MCGSINPGATMRLEASTRSAPAGRRTVSAVPTSAMCVSSIIRRAGDSLFVGVRSVPASIATILGLLTAGSHVSDDPAEVSVRFGQPLFGLPAPATRRTHENGDLQLTSG